jgi:hypothetical protein
MANTDDMHNPDPETQAAILKGIDELARELEKFKEEMSATFGEVNSLLSGVEAAVVRLVLVSTRLTPKSPLTTDDIPGETARDKLGYLLKQIRPQHGQPEQP